MKKATLIMIFVIYLVSIVLISFFGLKAKVYEEVIPVTQIECLNTSDDKTTVTENDGLKVIEVKFIGPGNIENLTGTILQLYWRVSPDNATNVDVQFIYNEELEREGAFTFVKRQGKDIGLIVFNEICQFAVTIESTDGTRVDSETIVIDVY